MNSPQIYVSWSSSPYWFSPNANQCATAIINYIESQGRPLGQFSPWIIDLMLSGF